MKRIANTVAEGLNVDMGDVSVAITCDQISHRSVGTGCWYLLGKGKSSRGTALYVSEWFAG